MIADKGCVNCIREIYSPKDIRKFMAWNIVINKTVIQVQAYTDCHCWQRPSVTLPKSMVTKKPW